MKSINQQEILLVIGSTLSKRQLCERDANKNVNQFSQTEQLEAACWSGLLDDLLPEIVAKSASGKRLSLWQIRQGDSFLEIELSECPPSIEAEHSIDPYCFLRTMFFN